MRPDSLLLLIATLVGCSFDRAGYGSSVDGDGGGEAPLDGSPSQGDASPPDDAPAMSTFCADPSLAACYELDRSLDDGTPYGNHLSGTDVAFASGVAGDALVTSASSRITGPTASASLDMTDAFTIELWVLAEVAQDRLLVDHDQQWRLQIESDGAARCTVFTLDRDGDIRSDFIFAGDVNAGAWTFLACSYDGNDLRLYQDGALINEREVSGQIRTEPSTGFSLGQDAPSGNAFIGALDQVRIWNRARSSDEMACTFVGDC